MFDVIWYLNHNVKALDSMLAINKREHTFCSEELQNVELEIARTMYDHRFVVRLMTFFKMHKRLENKYPHCDGIADAFETMSRSRAEFVKTYDLYHFV